MRGCPHVTTCLETQVGMQQQQEKEGSATVVVAEAAAARPVLRVRSGAGDAQDAPRMRVTWTPDTVEINEFSGKKKSKSTPAHASSKVGPLWWWPGGIS